MQEQNVLIRSSPEAFAAMDADPDQALAQALEHYQAGRATDAETLYRSILAAHPDNAVASYAIGWLCNNQGRLQEAIDAYRHAIAIRPDYTDAYVNLGTVFLTRGEPEEAVTIFRQAIAISPQSAMAYGNLGKAFQDLGNIDDAIAAYRQAIAQNPDNAIANANLGSALLDQKNWEEAVAVTHRAIALWPDNVMAHVNLGAALFKLGRHQDALRSCRQAMALQPQTAQVQATLGGAMLELGAWQEAETLCRQAIVCDPKLPIGHFNLSHALKAMNRLDEAIHAVREAIRLVPDSAEYHFHLAHLLLIRGDLEAGWVEYDWRWQLPDFAWLGAIHGIMAKPRWTGEDISDKTILILTEQGLGDIIQFARYLPLVVNRARQVIVAAHPPMRRLLATIPGITIVAMEQTLLPSYDVYCPLLSLPRAFATSLDTIPATSSYLSAPEDEQARWRTRLNARPSAVAPASRGANALRVGIVWSGNPATNRDYFRSPGLNNIRPLFSIPGIEFIVLQVGPGRNDLNLGDLPPHALDLGAEVTDLSDTAAIMANLDLMISSCTGPLHLAGALGVPTWAMIPYAPYFTWQLDRTDSPWYPSMRLYRQEQPGQEWSGVVNRIAADLAAIVRPSQGDAQIPDIPNNTSADAKHMTPMPETDGFNELATCGSGLMLFNRNDIYIGASLRKYGEFSGGESALFNILVQPGMTILDIGANIGVHTVDLSRLTGPTGTVHAFEPQRLMFQVMCANVALNSRPNVFTHNVAVGAVPGVILVPCIDPEGRDNYGGLSLSGAQQGESVPLITIDSLHLHACHLIKLDVEGMEVEALRGAADTIQRFRPLMYVENDRANRSADLIALLQSFDYRLYWHLPPLYRPNNFRADQENIFGNTISVNMICIPKEIPQDSLLHLREVKDPTDLWHQAPIAA